MGVDAMMHVDLSRSISDQQLALLTYNFARTFKGLVYHNRRIRALERDPEVQDRLRVNLACRYYGESYERGPGPQIIAVADYLARATRGLVYYGSDSSDAEDLCDQAWRERMWALILSHPPYRMSGDPQTTGPECSLCHVGTVECGWSGAITIFSCLACDEVKAKLADGEIITRDENDRSDNRFAFAHRAQKAKQPDY